MLNRLSAWFGTKPKTMETEDVKLPPDLPNWPLVKELLQDLHVRLNHENISEQDTGWFMQTVYNTIQSERQVIGSRDGQLDRLRLQIQSNLKKKLDSSSLWFGMLKYLRKISSDERDRFLYQTLPSIIEFALEIEEHQAKEPLFISRQQHGATTKLSRRFICSIVACFFLCLFPERKKESSKLNMVNFTAFFKHLPQSAQIAKLRCILHYFECVIDRGAKLRGSILFCRKVAVPSWMLTFDELVQCDLKLCPLYIHPQGAVEDSGSEAIQVCFGNRSVGGGVLGRSVVQEDIRFSTCPELMAAMLFMENMAANEAILVSGYERFSSCNGYGDSLEFAGHYSGPDQAYMMVTIDAASYREISFSKQFEEASILRDLNKAAIGFSWMPGTDGGAVQQWKVVEAESPVASDVAADIVASAMTDALRQAAESPTDPESYQPPCPHHQQPHLPCQQCHEQRASGESCVKRAASLQATHLLHTPDNPAETLDYVEDISSSAVPSSDRLLAAQSQMFLAHQSSSSPTTLNISTNSSLVSQSFAHSTYEPRTTVSTRGSAQASYHSPHSHQSHRLGHHNKRNFSLEHRSSSINSTPDRAFPMSSRLRAATESSALIRDPPISQSRLTHSNILSSHILGNLPRITMPSAGVASANISFNEDLRLLHSTERPELSEQHQEHYSTEFSEHQEHYSTDFSEHREHYSTEFSEHQEHYSTELSEQHQEHYSTELSEQHPEHYSTELSEQHPEHYSTELSEQHQEHYSTELSEQHQEHYSTELSEQHQERYNSELSEQHQEHYSTELSEQHPEHYSTELSEQHQKHYSTELSEQHQEHYSTELSEQHQEHYSTELSEQHQEHYSTEFSEQHQEYYSTELSEQHQERYNSEGSELSEQRQEHYSTELSEQHQEHYSTELSEQHQERYNSEGSELSEQRQEYYTTADIVIDVQVASQDSAGDSPSHTLPLTFDIVQVEPAAQQSSKIQVDEKYDIVNSIDVVLSLPALQSEFERVSSGLSNSSMIVSVGSQSMSANSAEEESIRQPMAEVLYINVEHSEHPHGAWRDSRDKVISDAATSSMDSMLLEPPFSSSPQSSVSSANVSPNTSFLTPESTFLEPPNGLSDAHATADFLEGLHSQTQHSSRRGSRDFYGELRDFLSSSSSGSRGSGSGGPLSSTNSSWGSRSGSISSHGTNGSTVDFLEFWSHFRRRSSQMSDTTSRRSSSSKHSSDFSTDLEEISEGIQKHNHGVIEEEGSLMSLVADFASHIVSVVVRDGLAVGVHLTASSEKHVKDCDEMNRTLGDAPKPSAHEQISTDLEVMDSIDHTICDPPTASAKTDLSVHHQIRNEQPEASSKPSGQNLSLSSVDRQDFVEEEITCEQKELVLQSGSAYELTSSGLSPAKAVNKLKSTSRFYVSAALSSPAIARCQSPITSKTEHHLEGQPSASHSLDSGFSSAISSINLTPQLPTVESSKEETCKFSSINTSVTQPDSSRSLTAKTTTVHPLLNVALPLASTVQHQSDNLSAERLEQLNHAPESETGKQSISSLKAEDKTEHTTLEPMTNCFSHISASQSTSVLQRGKQMEQMHQLESASSDASVGLHPTLSEHTFDVIESAEASLPAAKNDTHLAKKSSAGAPKAVGRGLKYFRRQKAEEDISVNLETQTEQKNSVIPEASNIPEAATVLSNSSLHAMHNSFSDGNATSKSSFIPKFKDSIKRLSGCSEHLAPPGSKSKSAQKHISSTSKDRQKADAERSQKDSVSSIHRKAEKELFKPHKSRYVISDIAAAPVSSKRKKAKTSVESEASMKRQSEKRTLKRHDEKKKKQKSDPSRHDPLHFTKSPRFVRFVSSIAKVSLSQALLEGAEILTQDSGGRGARTISDELYNWFATKIVTEVFLYVVNELGMQHSGRVADTPLPSGSAAADDNSVPKGSHSPSASKNEMAEAGESKPKGILPTKSDNHASSSKGQGQLKPSGSLKVVKFKDSRLEVNSSSALSHLQTHITVPNSSKTTPTFHRHSSNIPVPMRRRNSVDLPSLSPPGAHAASLSSSKSLRSSQESSAFVASYSSLTSKDLSINIYQAAATIVSHVLQAVSDSFDAQALSPVSSSRLDTASSSDTTIHSTGSRIHSNYNSIASNIFSSSSIKVSDSPKRSMRPVSPCIGIFSRKPMSRETLTNAFLKVDSTPNIKSYERRSSEPCQTSVQLSLQAFNSIKFSQQAVEDKHRNISRTDDDIGRGKTWRRGSLDECSFERRHSCGFKDPVLSRFAEELMKADTSVPELVIVGSNPGSSSAGSRRSSLCATYKETIQANFESDLLNASFTSVCSLPMSHSSHSQCRRNYMDRSHSRESRNWKSDSSDTEYWFPPPKIVGDEFQQEYNRQHSQEELQDYAGFFAGRVVQEAVCVLRCDPAYLSREEQGVELFAENLMDQIMRDALIATIHDNNNHSSRLVNNHRESGNSSQKQATALHKGAGLKSENSDSKNKVYYVQGARPKTSMPVSTRSKNKSVTHKRGNHHLDYQKLDGGSISRQASARTDRNTSMVSGHERLASLSQDSSYTRSRERAVSLDDSVQDSSLHHNVQKHTADLRPTSSRAKRHSTASSVPPSSSLLPTVSHSAKPPSTFHRVQSGTSTSHRHAPEKHVSRARSKTESPSTATSSIPVYRSSCEPSQLKIVSKTQRGESRASSASSVSSYHSEQTESSLPSSSGSESMDTSGKDNVSRKQRGNPEKVSQKLGSTKMSTGHKERSRRRMVYARRAATDHSVRSGRDGDLASEQSIDRSPVIDQFAANLSIAVMDNALLYCRDNRWLRFLSYERPIATGNWGCGAYRGNAQLKLVIQWIAASVGQAPSMMYYTFNDTRLAQAQEVAEIISGQTVGRLAEAVRDYCNWVHLYLASLSSSFFSPASRPQKSSTQTGTSHSSWKEEQDTCLPQTLFDFLLEKFQV